MADTLSTTERSRRMSLIRGRDTRPEMSLRRALHAQGLRYRIHYKKLPGKPDIVFGPAKVAVLVNGCFWHGHNCADGHIPKSNVEFWRNKILKNRSRDARNITALRKAGWKIVIVWECQLRRKDYLSKKVQSIISLVLNRRIELQKKQSCKSIRSRKTPNLPF